MRTAALLPTPGDPFILSYWLRNYDQVWRGEVDELRVLVNGQMHKEVLQACREMVEEVGATFLSDQGEGSFGRMGHGEAVAGLLKDCTADTVVLVEEDAYVRHPGAMTQYLQMAADGAVVGTPRGGMSGGVERAAMAKWGPVPDPHGYTENAGHGIWPCFLFASREYLWEAAPFQAMTWRTGQTIPGLDFTVTEEWEDTDTFTAAAFKLRALTGDRFVYIPQHKELWQKEYVDSPFIHAGGLSHANMIHDWAVDCRKDCGGTYEGKDWACRAWWWTRIIDTAGDVVPERQTHWRECLQRLIDWTGTAEQLAEWDATLRPWVNWNDEP